MENDNKKSESALREERILQFWRENDTFQKSLDKKAPKGHYVFYDGPPFATGQIHYGHILGSTVKDVIGRYKTMQGYYVPRKWGWDCHGLPIENIVEKELGVAGHKEIEALGIDKFVEHARSKVMQYDKDWEKGIERIGRWVDFKGSYKTMDNTFIESVWWALSELNKKNLIYEGVRVLAYCARCETPIANSEIAMDNSYKDIADISIYVKFELEDEPGTYLIAWTTTPWTLPGNTAIAINKNIKYVKVKVGDENFILAEDTLIKVLKDKEHSVLGEVKADSLLGKKYKPVFPYYKNVDMPNKENIWKIWHADFVTTEKGSGIAHEAPAFGEEDSVLAKANNIPMIVHVDETGRFKADVTDFAGLKVKPKDTPEDKDAHLRSDIEVIKYLQQSGAYFDKEKIMHSYPHCMRCDTPIIYYALPSWFINITKVKGDIVETAKEINWMPAHLKEGRFKNIVENAPDWNISRNRYWASPLPIWKCDVCKKKTFVSSVADLQSKAQKSGNEYFLMRHGESDHNLKNLVSTMMDGGSRLTEVGKKQTRDIAEKVKNEGIDMIITSPFTRTLQTTEIVKEILGLKDENIIKDSRLGELNVKSYEGRTWVEYHNDFPKVPENFDKAKEGDESYQDVRTRMMNLLFDLEGKYKNKKILLVTHGGPAWLAVAGVEILNAVQSLKLIEDKKNFNYLNNSEVQKLPFAPFPHDRFGNFDLHRPYIDQVDLVCDCGGELTRVPEVLDCWFESGSMPFAQDHYPFENKDWKQNNFPAGFIAEYIAQTRTWFYYTHVVSAMMFKKAAFKNVVTTGTLRAEDGEKMSKSKKNYPDPWIFIDKYGVDALRIYLMSSTLMKGEDANFSEKAVQDIASKVIGRLFNVLAFYELYRDISLEKDSLAKSEDLLDKWIMERFYQTLEQSTKGMEMYDVVEATRPIEPFVDDLSTWYLRRSRERIKDGDKNAKATLYFILKNLAKMVAPFAPVAAEDIWLRLKHENNEESVHLTTYPTEPFKLFSFGKSKIVDEMQRTRDIVTLGLESRQKAGLKVRQPLSKLEVKNLGLKDAYLELIKDELNVKQVTEDKNLSGHVSLDLNITEELKQEGDYRELVRGLQDMRKKIGLTPSEPIKLMLSTDELGKNLVKKFETDLKKTVLVSVLEFAENNGEEIKVENLVFKVKIEK